MNLNILSLVDNSIEDVVVNCINKYFPSNKLHLCRSFREAKAILSSKKNIIVFLSSHLGPYNSYYFFSSITRHKAFDFIIFDTKNNDKYNQRYRQNGAIGLISLTKSNNYKNLSKDLLTILHHHRIITKKPKDQQQRLPQQRKHFKLIVIGASTGGPETIRELFRHLNNDLPPILVALHIPRRFSKIFADQLNLECSFGVKEASHGDIVSPGQAYITPGESHLSCQKTLHNQCRLMIQEGRGEHLFCPSVDVLFESAAKSFKNEVISTILTGMGSDGAQGMLSLKKCGAITLSQEEKSCVVYGMPRAAVELQAVGSVLSIKNMAKYINTIAYKIPILLFSLIFNSLLPSSLI